MLHRRTPQGVRGLKLLKEEDLVKELMSHSARSAWIETDSLNVLTYRYDVALRKECVD